MYERNDNMKLDGLWDFLLDEENIGEKNEWYKAFPKDCEKIVVPSCWNNELGKYEYEGTAWYHTTFYHSSGDLILHFGAVSTYAKVYVDGNFIAEHYGGFTSFDITCESLKQGVHDLVVMVQALYNDTDTIPLSVVDWFHYGGIIRSVEAFSKNGCRIDKLKIDYTLNDDLTEAYITLNITAAGGKKTTYKLYIDDDFIEEVSVSDGENTINIHLDNIRLWDTESPNLYTFRLESENDVKIQRTGFRKISIDGYNFMLNNKPFKIKGINRHEEHPDWGFSLPLKLMKKDMDILSDMNVNCIRGSHYPNSQEFLDYCDEVGMLFWSEIPMWGIPEAALENPLFTKRAKTMMSEMLEQYCNHPSIIIWGLHNECDTNTEAGYKLTKELYALAKNSGGNRLITFASFKPFDDICFEFCDFISMNRYTGWYVDTLEDWSKFLDDFFSRLDKLGLGHLPVVMSEFGAAGIYGECNFESPKWSENYQSLYMKKAIDEFFKRERISGTFVWQFADIRVCRQKVLDRARGFNNKGILNEYRKPKMAYYTIKDIYSNL